MAVVFSLQSRLYLRRPPQQLWLRHLSHRIPIVNPAWTGLRPVLFHRETEHLIRANNVKGAALLVLHSLNTMFRPKITTVNAVLQAQLKQCKYAHLLSLFRAINESGIVPNIETCEIILQTYFNAGRPDMAMDFFYKKMLHDSLPFVQKIKPTTYSILVKGLVDNGELHQALELKSLDKSSLDESYVDGYLMLGYARNNDPNGIRDMYQGPGSLSSGLVCGNLIKAYFMRGMEEEAMAVYRTVLQCSHLKPSLDYNPVIHALCKNGKFEEALKLFRIKGKLKEDVILSYQKDNKCHLPPSDYWVEMNSTKNYATFSVMADGYCERGRFMEALEVFRKVGDHSYMNLINYLSKKLAKVEELYQEIKERGMEPDEHTHLFLLLIDNTSIEETMPGDQVACFDQMVQSTLWSNVAVYKRIIENMVKAGKIDAAESIFDLLANKFKFDEMSKEYMRKKLIDQGSLDLLLEDIGVEILDDEQEEQHQKSFIEKLRLLVVAVEKAAERGEAKAKTGKDLMLKLLFDTIWEWPPYVKVLFPTAKMPSRFFSSHRRNTTTETEAIQYADQLRSMFRGDGNTNLESRINHICEFLKGTDVPMTNDVYVVIVKYWPRSGFNSQFPIDYLKSIGDNELRGLVKVEYIKGKTYLHTDASIVTGADGSFSLAVGASLRIGIERGGLKWIGGSSTYFISTGTNDTTWAELKGVETALSLVKALEKEHSEALEKEHSEALEKEHSEALEKEHSAQLIDTDSREVVVYSDSEQAVMLLTRQHTDKVIRKYSYILNDIIAISNNFRVEKLPRECNGVAHSLSDPKLFNGDQNDTITFSGKPDPESTVSFYHLFDANSLHSVLSGKKSKRVQHIDPPSSEEKSKSECDFDVSSKSASGSSSQSSNKYELPGIQSVKKPSPYPTPLKLSDEMQTTGAEFASAVGILTSFEESLALSEVSLVSQRELSGNGHVPPELGKLTELFDLNVTDNQLEGPIPANLSSCTNLISNAHGNKSYAGRHSN